MEGFRVGPDFFINVNGYYFDHYSFRKKCSFPSIWLKPLDLCTLDFQLGILIISVNNCNVSVFYFC
jgi:hypothetical protein